jgi:predicted O-methyltransferase YrrM
MIIPAFVRRLCRTVFCRGGYGVHSPFAFDLITTVIEERSRYYCYGMLDDLRAQLRQERRRIRYGGRELTVRRAIRRLCFSTEGCRLLFRLANRFRPAKILVVGSGFGLTPLYVTACVKGADCLVVEPSPVAAVIARNLIRKYAHSSISVYDGKSGDSALPDLTGFDMIVWGKTGVPETALSAAAVERMLRYATSDSLLIVAGINESRAAKQAWKGLCVRPEVSATFDLYTFGIVFFTPKLHRKTCRCIPF